MTMDQKNEGQYCYSAEAPDGSLQPVQPKPLNERPDASDITRLLRLLVFSRNTQPVDAMIHYFCFTIEPLPSHPRFSDVQAGWAHVFLRTDDGDAESEAKARTMVEDRKWKIQKLQICRHSGEDSLALSPPEAQLALMVRDHHIEFAVYERGGGPAEPGHPFE